MRRRRTFSCTDCDRLVTRARSTGQPLVCIDCGINRSLHHSTIRHNAAITRRGWTPDGTILPSEHPRITRIIAMTDHIGRHTPNANP